MNYEEYSDSQLCSMICENDEHAKDILFEKYKYIIDIVIKKYSLSATKVGIEYKDFYQEALVGFSDAINSYRDNMNAKMSTFITLCVERRLQNTIIKAKAIKNEIFVKALSLDYQVTGTLSALKDVISDEHKYDPLYNITNEEKYNELVDKIKNELSDNEYEVYILLISGLTYQQIAKQLGKTPKQVDNTIQRIRNKIKKILD